MPTIDADDHELHRNRTTKLKSVWVVVGESIVISATALADDAANKIIIGDSVLSHAIYGAAEKLRGLREVASRFVLLELFSFDRSREEKSWTRK
jgi:hypothetical protein